MRGEATSGWEGSATHDEPRDDFEAARRETDAVRDALQDVRRDVEVIVREEVGRSAADPRRIEALIRDTVRREVRVALDDRTPWLIAQIGWLGPVMGIAVGVALGLSGYAAFSARTAGESGAAPAISMDTGIPATTPSVAGREGAAETPAAPGIGADPASRAAAYDSLLAAAAPALEPLVARLEAAAPSGAVRTAIAAYRLDQLTPELRDRLHAAFVQLALRERIRPELVLDGQILRNPCGGASCGALLELWQTEPASAGWPAYTASVATDPTAVRQAESTLVGGALHELMIAAEGAGS